MSARGRGGEEARTSPLGINARDIAREQAFICQNLYTRVKITRKFRTGERVVGSGGYRSEEVGGGDAVRLESSQRNAVVAATCVQKSLFLSLFLCVYRRATAEYSFEYSRLNSFLIPTEVQTSRRVAFPTVELSAQPEVMLR